MSTKYKEGSIYDECIMDDAVKEIYMEKFDKTFYIKKLSVKEYEPIAKAALKQELAIKNEKIDSMTQELVAVTIIQSLVDKTGRKLLDMLDFDKVMEFDNEIATEICNQALQYNNPEFKEIKKKL